jgi:hypothetical protein
VQTTVSGDFDPAELTSSQPSGSEPSFLSATLPLAVVIVVNFLLSLVILPRLDFSYLAEPRWGGPPFRPWPGSGRSPWPWHQAA